MSYPVIVSKYRDPAIRRTRMNQFVLLAITISSLKVYIITKMIQINSTVLFLNILEVSLFIVKYNFVTNFFIRIAILNSY